MNRKPLLLAVWSRHRSLLLGLGTLLVLNILLVLILYFGVSPALSQTERDLVLLQQQVRKGDLFAPQKVFAQGEEDYERFQALLPPLRNFSELIGDLYALATSSNLEIGQITYVEKVIPESNILSYSLKFSLIGTYSELKRFVYGLEDLDRLVVIEQIALNSTKGDAGEGLVNLSMGLTTYFSRGGTEE